MSTPPIFRGTHSNFTLIASGDKSNWVAACGKKLFILGVMAGWLSGTAQGQTLEPTNKKLAHFIDSLYRNDQLPFERAIKGEISGDSARPSLIAFTSKITSN